MERLQNWRGRLGAIVLAAAAVAVVSVASVAADQPDQRAQRGPRMGRGVYAQLNLTADQRTQIQGIQAKHREENQAIMQQMRTARQSLRSAIFAADAPDNARIDQLTDQILELEGKALRARTATEVEVASVLTADQRQKMAAMPGPGPRGGRARW